MDKNKLRSIVRHTLITKFKKQGINKYSEYRMLNQVPDLIPILVDLLSKDFHLFVRDIEWVAPKPQTFKVVLENDHSFYLSNLTRSWVAEVEGKKYYLLNLAEEEMATSAIARVLRYGKPVNPQVNEESFMTGAEPTPPPPSSTPPATTPETPPTGPETTTTEPGETVTTPVGEIPADLL
jgi:hypothetical protein